jgi:hypothetical protein
MIRYNNSKYNNKNFFCDGIRFDSMKEAYRYQELKLMEKKGLISELKLQPKFELLPCIKKFGQTYRKVTYIADFKYYDVIEKRYIVEDVKGFKTKDFILKQKMFVSKYDLELRLL